MAFVKFAADTQKCATCERWSGPRRRNPDDTQVEVDAELARGDCVGGPWDGTERDPLTRCGRWIQWAISEQ